MGTGKGSPGSDGKDAKTGSARPKSMAVPPARDRKTAGPDSVNEKAAPRGVKPLEKRIREARAALHAAIQEAGDRPLSECPEVLRRSRELDKLLDETQKKTGGR